MSGSVSSKGPCAGDAKLKIGVMGGASAITSRDLFEKAHELGRAIAQADCVLVTGACPGLPLAAACGAKEHGGLVIGISPALSLDEHVHRYGSPTAFHDVLVFTGSGLMGREVVNIRTSDAVVIVGGRSGTLGELAISYDEGKLIGVLRGSGGISDLVPEILAACAKDTGSRVLYDGDPARLVSAVVGAYRTDHHRRPSCFCARGVESDDTGDSELDPICGMRLTEGAAHAVRTIAGRRFFLCSRRCLEAFEARPPHFASPAGVPG